MAKQSRAVLVSVSGVSKKRRARVLRTSYIVRRTSFVRRTSYIVVVAPCAWETPKRCELFSRCVHVESAEGVRAFARAAYPPTTGRDLHFVLSNYGTFPVRYGPSIVPTHSSTVRGVSEHSRSSLAKDTSLNQSQNTERRIANRGPSSDVARWTRKRRFRQRERVHPHGRRPGPILFV